MKFTNFRKKPINIREEENSPYNMSRTLSVRDLTLLGIAAVIGAGIFSTIGTASYHGGPGVTTLFIIIAITCGFCALCYAEFASRIPQSGSAYTYAYVSFGEIFAWIIGWALILEYAIGNVVVAISWSEYFHNLLHGIGLELPYWLTTGYYSAYEPITIVENAKLNHEIISSEMVQNAQLAAAKIANSPEFLGHKILLNLPAFLIVVIITWIAYIGMKESKIVSNFMVILKLAVIALVIGLGFFYITPRNWIPFFPNGLSSTLPDGTTTGVLAGVSAVFFAYIGFDAISTTAEECKNPQKDLPRGMINTLVFCTILYIIISLVLTGIVNYKELKVDDPLAFVFEKINLNWVSYIISISAIIATTSVLLVFQLGQPRIWMSMSRDGLLPKRYSRIHPVYKTPSYATIVTGILVGFPALFMPSSLVTDLTSIGTLFAFILVCLGVLALPKVKKEPKRYNIPYVNSLYVIPIVTVLFYFFTGKRILVNIHNIASINFSEILFVIFSLLFLVLCIVSIVRKFNAIPILGTLCCMYLMISIPTLSWILFIVWMLIGLIIYFSYGYKKSKLKQI